MYLQGEGIPAPHGGLCAALCVLAGRCGHVLCPAWSLGVLLPSAAEGCINETREVDHQALIMPPLPHSAQYWVLLVLKIFPKH